MTQRALQHYLNRHCEPRSAVEAERISGTCERALVVPMFDEAPQALDQLLQHQTHHLADTLFIIIVNAPSDAAAGPLARTRRLLRSLRGKAGANQLIIDCTRANRLLPPRQGVGLARKLGTDTAAHLFARGQLRSPWLYQTDADAVLPAAYFDRALPDHASAVVFAHHHSSADPVLQQAAQLYEAHMAHYLNGLARAGSRYAFPTLGSTICINALAYAKVRGYPRRDAAEDFYLLNKLAKVGPVEYLPDITVQLQARASQRVPFGTGPSLQRIAQGLALDPSGEFFVSYHPHSFRLLRNAITYLRHLASHPLAEPGCAESAALLRELGLERVRERIALQYPRAEHRAAAYQDWFDAKRTLRFIHLARRLHPDQSLLATQRQSAEPPCLSSAM